MDLPLSFSTSSIPFFVLLLSTLWLWIRRKNSSKKKLPPQAGDAWPLLGHLHFLGGPEPPHLVLSRLADKYGPIFTVKLGVHQAIVINNHELAKECLTTNDRVFANRPKTLTMEILGYNHAIFTFSPYGAYWRHARKIATLELLSNRHLDMPTHVREAEITESIKELHQHWYTNKNGSGQSLVVTDQPIPEENQAYQLGRDIGDEETELSKVWADVGGDPIRKRSNRSTILPYKLKDYVT